MSGHNEGSTTGRDDETTADQPDVLEVGDFSEELEEATDEADQDLGADRGSADAGSE